MRSAAATRYHGPASDRVGGRRNADARESTEKRSSRAGNSYEIQRKLVKPDPDPDAGMTPERTPERHWTTG